MERLRKVRNKPPIEERYTTKNVSPTLARSIVDSMVCVSQQSRNRILGAEDHDSIHIHEVVKMWKKDKPIDE
jgi:hypothetical protein